MNKRYSDFGFPVLFDVMPTAIEDNIVKTAMDAHMDALASFVVERPHFDRRRCVIGSGFFAFSPDPAFALLCTAAHVIDDFVAAGFGWVTVGTLMIELRDVGFRRIDKVRDIAFWYIPSDFLIAYGITTLPTFPLHDTNFLARTFAPTCSFAIFGYPGTKNRDIDMRDGGDRDRKLFGMAVHGYEFDVETQELCFFYAGKGTPEAWGNPQITSVNLAGMSGGPCVQFVIHREMQRLGIVVVGVFGRWKGKRELRAAVLGSPWLTRDAPPL
ncbi:hypothetical protein [Paraburkholderia kururiensis]|uniref:hypothetical protein n=1 Tax=Paraburkholderia kururiensis TaxID=984307 RepID=UPI0039A73B0A